MSSTEVNPMYIAPAFGGFGLIVAPSASERVSPRIRHDVRVDRRPGDKRSH